MTTIMILAAVLWGCGDTNDDNHDRDSGSTTYQNDSGFHPEGWAELTIFAIDGEGAVNDAPIVLATTSMSIHEAYSGDVMTLPAPETYTVKVGNRTGCDGQGIHEIDSSETVTALEDEIDLEPNEVAEMEMDLFPYYEWAGRLKCSAWDDYGWSTTSDPVDYTNEDTQITCVDKYGKVHLTGGDRLVLSDGEPSVNGDGAVNDLEISSEGLSLTWIGEGGTTHVDCVVIE